MTFYVVIRGPLGIGKSTIAKRLSRILKAKYIAIDRILDLYDLTKDRENGYISQRSFKKANEIITPIAKKILKGKKPVIFDGNFYWRSQIDDLIQGLHFPHFVFTLKSPLHVCIRRDADRKKPHGKDAARAVYKKSIKFVSGIVIDATKPPEECVKKIISYLPS